MKSIKLTNFSKTYDLNLTDSYEVFKKSNFSINQGEKIGLLGPNGAGKTTLCNLISGNELLSEGIWESNGTCSWPIGVFSSLSGNLTAKQNIAFICNLLNLDYKKMKRTVLKASGLEKHGDRKIVNYSAGMKAKLAFFIALSIDFDFFIFDEVTSVGDQSFRKKADLIFKETLRDKGMILCSHNINVIKKHCQFCYIIYNKRLSRKYSIDEAMEIYNKF